MNEGKQGQPAETSTAAASNEAAGAATSQPDLSRLTLEEIDQVLYHGAKVEVPVAGGEGKQTTEQVEAPTATEAKQVESGEPTLDAEPVATDEAVETRTPEEIQAAQDEAAKAVAEAGGDETEQQAAAEAAAQPAKPVNRPRLDEREQLIMGLYQKAKRDGKPITLAEAEARIDGPPPTEEAPEDAPAVVEAVDHGALIGALEAEIAQIESDLSEKEDGLYTKEVRDLTSALTEKRTKLVLAQEALNAAAARAVAVSDANRAKAHAKALEDYPDAADDQTPLGRDIAQYVKAIKDPKHPDHPLLYADSAPLTIARNRAAELGIAPAKKKAVSPPAVATQEPVPQRKVVSPAAGNKTSVVPVKPAESQQARVDRLMKSDNLAELDAAFGADPATLLAGAVR